MSDGDLGFGSDESYRTCSQCGADCYPDSASIKGKGIRLVWTCPNHGVHSVVDPFHDFRDSDGM